MKPIIFDQATQWPDITSECELIVAFGGLPHKNAQVNLGGVGRHTLHEEMNNCYESGIEIRNISPLKSDIAEHFDQNGLAFEQIPMQLLMLAICLRTF
jgi:hypothetical protein